MILLEELDVRCEKDGKNMKWGLYECSCGNQFECRVYCINSKHTQSCGCMKGANKKHGLIYTRLYRIWAGIKTRCFNSNHRSYKYYGARGIKICEEWLQFVPFYNWAINSNYEEGLTIERINNDGNYEPINCTWIPQGKQVENQRMRIDNKTGFVGIYQHKKNGKYIAKATINGKQKHIGTFKTVIKARQKRKEYIESNL